ncbi:MAG: hypothetical protein OQK12_13060 [Motiliproteus sp.]|nr:hypothetical protein [Motiliproteus sp.]MCW9053160.1 hypothetical protein [Motiliproteus sp.]
MTTVFDRRYPVHGMAFKRICTFQRCNRLVTRLIIEQKIDAQARRMANNPVSGCQKIIAFDLAAVAFCMAKGEARNLELLDFFQQLWLCFGMHNDGKNIHGFVTHIVLDPTTQNYCLRNRAYQNLANSMVALLTEQI